MGGFSMYNLAMSVVEDVRKVLQDSLGPELRALTARLDAADKVAEARYQELKSYVESRYQELKSSADARYEEMKTNAEVRHQEIKANAEARHQEIMTRLESLQNSLELDKRVERLENRQPRHPS